jgi:hypothetical protein
MGFGFVYYEKEARQVKRALLATLGVGIGWILGITVMMVLMPISGIVTFRMGINEAIASMFFFSFPGFILLMIAIILALNEDPGKNIFDEKF